MSCFISSFCYYLSCSLKDFHLILKPKEHLGRDLTTGKNCIFLFQNNAFCNNAKWKNKEDQGTHSGPRGYERPYWQMQFFLALKFSFQLLLSVLLMSSWLTSGGDPRLLAVAK